MCALALNVVLISTMGTRSSSQKATRLPTTRENFNNSRFNPREIWADVGDELNNDEEEQATIDLIEFNVSLTFGSTLLSRRLNEMTVDKKNATPLISFQWGLVLAWDLNMAFVVNPPSISIHEPFNKSHKKKKKLILIANWK